MPAERPMSKASENRRATKPIMEKRRRARINQCLSELKTLILDALNKDPSRHSKLEKADILEMTVRHLQNIQRQQMAAAISTDSSVLNKFKAGFNECATEVTRYVSRIEGVDPALRQRLLSHLSSCLTTMNNASHFQQQQSFQSNMLQSLSVQIPAGLRSSSNGDINNNATGKVFAGLSVIPSRLPNGDFAFLLPSQSIPGSFHLPSSSVSASSSLPSSSGPDRNSQSSWPPTSPSSKRCSSPDAMSEDNVVLSPTCSDAGSDVFIEPSYHPSKHHQQHAKEMVLSPVPNPMHRLSPLRHEMVTSPVPHNMQTHKDRHDVIMSPVPHNMHKDRRDVIMSPAPHTVQYHKDINGMVVSPVPHNMHKDRQDMILSPVPLTMHKDRHDMAPHSLHRSSPLKERHEMVLSPVPHHVRRSSPHKDRQDMILSPVNRMSPNKDRHIIVMSRQQQVSESENVWRPW